MKLATSALITGGLAVGFALFNTFNGSIAVIIVVGSFIGAVATAMTQRYDVEDLEQDIVETAEVWGIPLSVADCPDDQPLSAGSKFTCTGYGTEGRTFTVTGTVESDGFDRWVVQ